MSFYYICDKCGHLVTTTDAAIPDDGQEGQCDQCGSVALWEFTNKQHALAHAARIERSNRSGIFRTR